MSGTLFLYAFALLTAVTGAAHTREQHTVHMISARSRPEFHFQQWVAEHSKPYAGNPVEYARRLAIWLENLEYILSYNAKHSGHWLGLNSLADLTHDEYRERYLGFDNAKRLQRPKKLGAPFKYASVEEKALPVSIDWREKGAVSEVKNQAQCGKRCLNAGYLLLAITMHALYFDTMREMKPHHCNSNINFIYRLLLGF